MDDPTKIVIFVLVALIVLFIAAFMLKMEDLWMSTGGAILVVIVVIKLLVGVVLAYHAEYAWRTEWRRPRG